MGSLSYTDIDIDNIQLTARTSGKFTFTYLGRALVFQLSLGMNHMLDVITTTSGTHMFLYINTDGNLVAFMSRLDQRIYTLIKRHQRVESDKFSIERCKIQNRTYIPLCKPHATDMPPRIRVSVKYTRVYKIIHDAHSSKSIVGYTSACREDIQTGMKAIVRVGLSGMWQQFSEHNSLIFGSSLYATDILLQQTMHDEGAPYIINMADTELIVRPLVLVNAVENNKRTIENEELNACDQEWEDIGIFDET